MTTVAIPLSVCRSSMLLAESCTVREMVHFKVPMPEPKKISEVLGVSMDKAEMLKDDRHTAHMRMDMNDMNYMSKGYHKSVSQALPDESTRISEQSPRQRLLEVPR